MKIAIFDMDGTLANTQDDITESINHVRQLRYDLPPLGASFVVDAINAENRNLSKIFYDQEQYLEEDRLMFEAHYTHQCVQSAELYEGIKPLLHQLSAHEVKLAVCSNAPQQFVERILTHLEIAPLFDVLMGASAQYASKPEPDMLFAILEQLRYNKQHDSAWMIGDNSKDIAAAKGADIGAIFATWGFSSTSSCDIYCDIPSDVATYLLEQ